MEKKLLTNADLEAKLLQILPSRIGWFDDECLRSQIMALLVEVRDASSYDALMDAATKILQYAGISGPISASCFLEEMARSLLSEAPTLSKENTNGD